MPLEILQLLLGPHRTPRHNSSLSAAHLSVVNAKLRSEGGMGSVGVRAAGTPAAFCCVSPGFWRRRSCRSFLILN